MSATEHPESLEDFANGRLSDQENEAILAHLVSCPACEAEAEQLWQAVAPGRALPMASDEDLQEAAVSERSLFRRIHRSELGGQLVRLYTEGFIGLLTTLLSPIVSNIRRPGSSGDTQ